MKRLSIAYLVLAGLALALQLGMGAGIWRLSRPELPGLDWVYGGPDALEGVGLRYEGLIAGEAAWSGSTAGGGAGYVPADGLFWRFGFAEFPSVLFGIESEYAPGGWEQYAALSFNRVYGPDGRALEDGGSPLWPLSGQSGDGISASSSCFATPCGWMYLSFDAWDRGAGSGRRLDPAGLPGGSWGLWRVPFEPRTELAGRWWASGGYDAVCPDPSRVENVLPLPDDYAALDALVSYDGLSVYCAVLHSDSSLELAVLDAGSGEALRRIWLAGSGEAGDGCRVYGGEGWAAVCSGGACWALEDGGAETLELDMAALLPEGAAGLAGRLPDRLCYSGGKLAALYWLADEISLAVYEDGALAALAEVSLPCDHERCSRWVDEQLFLEAGCAR